MRKIVGKCVEFVVSLLYLMKWVVKKVVRKDFARMKKQVRRSRPVKILGNGPSLCMMLGEFANRRQYDVCCVNWSVLSESFFEIRPEYYVTVDPMFFSKSNVRLAELQEMIKKVDWEMVWFVPATNVGDARRMVAMKRNIKVEGHPTGLFLGMKIKSIRYGLMSKGLASAPAQNVVIAALYDLIMYGFQRLELYGVEHSWLQQIAVNDKNEVCLKDVHFYDKEVVELKPWMTVDGEVYTMHRILRDLAATFEGYHDVKEFANYIGGVEIVNRTPNSYIDAFKREV